MKTEYRRLSNRDDAPWQQFTNFDELIWSGVYAVRVTNDDGSLRLPFHLDNDDMLTLVVKDYNHDGNLQENRIIVQTLTRAERSTGDVFTYIRTRRSNKGVPFWSEWESSELLGGIDLQWDSSTHINDFVEQNTYNITGERTNSADGLPIINANPGHTISAKLIVLDSSINPNEVCVTQVLMLSNRLGNDGNVYIRTGCAASKHDLLSHDSMAWEAWGKLQKNVELLQVTSLDPFIDNGLYSGVLRTGSNVFETFILVTINNYAVATQLGVERCVSQFKYSLNIDGTFTHKTRVGCGGDTISWNGWVDLNGATTSIIVDGAVTEQKLSAGVREKLEAIDELRDMLVNSNTAIKNGEIIAGVSRDIYTESAKKDTEQILCRTSFATTSVSNTVLTLQQMGGCIIKNLVDGTFQSGWSGTYKVVDGVITSTGGLYYTTQAVEGHKYYVMLRAWSSTEVTIIFGSTRVLTTPYEWVNVSFVAPKGGNMLMCTSSVKLASALLIDLTDTFGEGNEPTVEECDKMFAAIGALSFGEHVATPTGLKSVGYNQFNSSNVIRNASIYNDTIVNEVSNSNIAVVECLPCRVGDDENNGYVIGYGEGKSWSNEGIEVHFSVINPLDGTAIANTTHLSVDTTYGTYVPKAHGYMLIVTPELEKLCVSFHWNATRSKNSYEPYKENSVSLPAISSMSKWGLASIVKDGVLYQDVIDFANKKYIKMVGKNPSGEYIKLSSSVTYNIDVPSPLECAVDDYGTEFVTGTTVPVKTTVKHKERSLVKELVRFIDRLMSGLATGDPARLADKMISQLNK